MFFLTTQILESNSRRVKPAFLKIQGISHIHKIDEIFCGKCSHEDSSTFWGQKPIFRKGKFTPKRLTKSCFEHLLYVLASTPPHSYRAPYILTCAN